MGSGAVRGVSHSILNVTHLIPKSMRTFLTREGSRTNTHPRNETTTKSALAKMHPSSIIVLPILLVRHIHRTRAPLHRVGAATYGVGWTETAPRILCMGKYYLHPRGLEEEPANIAVFLALRRDMFVIVESSEGQTISRRQRVLARP